MNRILFVMILGILVGLPGVGQAQCPPPSANPDKAFCEKDPRPEIKAFCGHLAELLSYANANPLADKQCFRNVLGNLDLTTQKGVDGFITASGATLAEKSAVSGALRDAGQARPDRQLSPNNETSGTTSLVSRAGSAELISLGVNSGVLTRSTNGTTATLSTNADELFRLITGNDPDCTVTCNSLGWFENRILNPTNISASLGLAQQNSATTATTGQASGTIPTQVANVEIPTGSGGCQA